MHDALLEHLRAIGLASEVRQDIDNAASVFAVIAAGTAWAAAPETLREHLPPTIVYRPVECLHCAVVNRTFWRRAGATPALLAFVAAVAQARDGHIARCDVES
jgi:hypothetical protein